MNTITIHSNRFNQFIDITAQVAEAIKSSGITDGIALVFTPHTTAGITINENADPDVLHDLEIGYKSVFPNRHDYQHIENNSDAHIKSSVTGCSVNLIISNGKPVLGTWQAVYFCEFDGPRTRKVYIQTVGNK